MKRQYKSDFKPFRGEVNDKKKFGYHLETLGYVPVDRQVDSFFRAGQKILDLDENYDSTEDDPADDRMLDVRDWELEDIGHAMVGLQQKTLSSSTADADKASKIEEAKNDVTSTPEKSGAEN